MRAKIFGLVLFIAISSTLFAQKPDAKTAQFLNTKELEWLKKHPQPLKVGITQIPNQVLKGDSGQYYGYAIDLFKKIEKQLSYSFEYVYFDTWEALVEAGARRDIDIIFLAQQTEQRLALYNFTDIVLIQQNKIITSAKHHNDATIKDLENAKVVAVRGSAVADYLTLNFPHTKLLFSKNETESIRMLLEGKADYTVAEPVRIGYYIKKNNIDDLYIANSFPYSYKLRIASRNDMPVINIILNKTLERIDATERKALALKWGYEKEVFFDKELLMKLFFAMLLIVTFLLYLFFLNRKLYQARTALEEINATLEERIAREVEKNREKELIMLHQSRLAQMGQILNMIAHQWRQPLNVLMSLNQVLMVKYKRQNGTLSQEDMESFYEKSGKQIQQMSQTIDDFRDFFKPRRNARIFQLNEVVEDLLQIILPIMQSHSITIRSHTSEKLRVKGYSNELIQALLNIINNAKDAIVQTDSKERYIEITLTSENGNALLSVCDSGGGIDEEIIGNIFDPYFSTKEEKNGTGIGLYMSKTIVETHMGGQLSVHNTPSGACFTISLPLLR